MPPKPPHFGALLTVFMLLFFLQSSDAQKKKGFSIPKPKIVKEIDEIFGSGNVEKKEKKKSSGDDTDADGKNQNSARQKKAGEQSIISETDFVQHAELPAKDPKNTRYQIAKSLAVDIPGIYPIGYNPRWRHITYNAWMPFEVKNYYSPSSPASNTKRNISIGSYKGKPMMRFGGFTSCDCFAEIVVKDSLTVLTEEPQTFQVTNFRKIENRKPGTEPCPTTSTKPEPGDGWEGKVTLSANKAGDIKMDLLVEMSRGETRTKEAGIMFRYVTNDIVIANEMPTEKALALVAAEEEQKRKYANYLKITQRQADSLQKVITKKYPQKECRECFERIKDNNMNWVTTKSTIVDGHGSVVGEETGLDLDINVSLQMKNKCNYELTFIGIMQLYDEQRGYYLKEVTRKLPANYEYSVRKGVTELFFDAIVGENTDIYLRKEFDVKTAMVDKAQWIRVVKE